MPFYAYIHCKPDGTPFYVGKGNDRRIKKIDRSHNQRHTNTVKMYGKDRILVGAIECSAEQISFDLEVGLIKRLEIMGVGLCNLTSGGDGGYKFTDDVRNKLCGDNNPAKRADVRAKLSNSMRGNQNGLGKIPTEEHKKKISLAHRGKVLTKEHREKLSLAKLGKVQSADTIKKRVAGLIGNSHTLGMAWINDGFSSRMIKKGVTPPEGWNYGRAKRRGK